MRIKLSKKDWENIGIKMGWIKEAFSNDGDANWEPDRRDMAESPGDLDPSFEDSDDEDSDFSYLTDGHEDDAKMIRLRKKAEELAGMYDDAASVHVALYWLLSNYHRGQNSPEYAALSSSPYSPGPLENGVGEEEQAIYEDLESVIK
jgi:hypothetical protein